MSEKQLNYGAHFVDNADIKAVETVLRGQRLTQGETVQRFEEALCEETGADYAVAVSNGTAALHLACLATGLKQGQELITSPISFVASANCAIYCNAEPNFSDVNEQGLLNASKLGEKLGEKTKVVVPVHYSGFSCEMDAMGEMCKQKGITVLEDASHAIGAKFKGKKVGGCEWSDMSVFSFHPVKHVTTGEGGAITTNDKKLYDKMQMLRTHGITKNAEMFENESHGPWYYEMQELGYNFRITDIQCALGISQLKKLPEFVEKRRGIAKKYDKAFETMKGIEPLQEKEGQFGSYHLYVIKVDAEKRKALFEHLAAKGINCQVHYLPIHLQPFYQKMGFAKGQFPNAESFYEKILSLPMYPTLKEEEQQRVIDEVKGFLDD